jgi:hypothetical protein
VHLVTTGSSLFRTPAGTTDVTRVCYAPCDVEVPLEDGYRLNVQGSTSKEFRLRGAPGSVVDLAVDPPSLGGIVGGGVLALGGGAAVYLTAIFADVNALTGTGGTTGEVVALVAGVGAMIVGGVVVANSLSTDVTQASGGERATATRVSPREPMWHLAERGPLDAPAGASVTLPLFAGRF